MYIYVYVCIYIYVYVYMHAYAHIYMYLKSSREITLSNTVLQPKENGVFKNLPNINKTSPFHKQIHIWSRHHVIFILQTEIWKSHMISPKVIYW